MTIRRALSRYAIFIALGVECVILALATDAFFTVDNLTNVLRQNAFPAVIAAGMTFVILTAGIDLSVGSVVGLSACCAPTRSCTACSGLAPGPVAARLSSARWWLIVTRIRVPPFVVTLAMMLVVRGAAYKYTNANTISGLPSSFAFLSQRGSMAAVMVVVFAIAWVLLMRTPFGRHVYATGGNRDAAWLSGVRVNRVLMAVYVLCGLSAGLAGVLVASRLNAGYPRAGERMTRRRRGRRRRRDQPPSAAAARSGARWRAPSSSASSTTASTSTTSVPTIR
jgi:ribose transport system permease protein